MSLTIPPAIILLLPILSAFCFRSGGAGRDDRFLPFMKPPTPWANKWWRWGMGVPIALITGNWLCIITYYLATSACAYGDGSWLEKFFGKSLKYFAYGFIFGAASFNMGNALWCGVLALSLKFWDTDHAWWEFTMGGLGTLVFVWG